MKKYTPYLIIIVLLALVSVYLLRTRREGTYRVKDRDFAVADTSTVMLIEMVRYGESILLSREIDGWRVNGIFQSHPERIKGLMMLLSRLEVSSPVSKSFEEKIRAGFDTDGITVRIQFMNGSEKSYRVYHDRGGSEKTYMLMDGSDIPFAMAVRGYRGDNLEEMLVPDTRYWRDNSLIHLSPQQINYIFLDHRQDPGATFQLDRNESGFFLLARGLLPDSWTEPDQERLFQYLQYFSDVHFEEYIELKELSSSGTGIDKEPGYVLKVMSRNLNPLIIELFPIYSLDSEGGKRMDPDRLIAGMDDGKVFVVMKYIEIDPILKPYSYFLGD